MLLFPPSTQHTPTTGGEGELIFQHAYYIRHHLLHLVPPSEQHTPTTGGERNLSFSTLTIFCDHLLHLVPPSTQHTPTTWGEGGTMTIGGGGGWLNCGCWL